MMGFLCQVDRDGNGLLLVIHANLEMGYLLYV